MTRNIKVFQLTNLKVHYKLKTKDLKHAEILAKLALYEQNPCRISKNGKIPAKFKSHSSKF